MDLDDKFWDCKYNTDLDDKFWDCKYKMDLDDKFWDCKYKMDLDDKFWDCKHKTDLDDKLYVTYSLAIEIVKTCFAKCLFVSALFIDGFLNCIQL